MAEHATFTAADGRKVSETRIERDKLAQCWFRVGRLSLALGDDDLFMSTDTYTSDEFEIFDSCKDGEFHGATVRDRASSRASARHWLACYPDHPLADELRAALRREEAYFAGWTR
jgi:hypothetical protein